MTIAEKLQTIAENEQKVYDAGIEAVWEAIQQGGAKTDYSGAFKRSSYNKSTFKPKYDMRVTAAYEMFRYSTSDNPVSMIDVEKEQGIVFDFSQAPSLTGTFAGSMFLELSIIDLRGKTDMSYCFYGGYGNSPLTKIQKIIVDENVVFKTTVFQYCSVLTYLRVEGTIASDNFNVQWSPLDHDSIVSIINALSTTTSGLTVTLSKSAVNTAFSMTDDAPSQEWSDLIATKQNWTISLV